MNRENTALPSNRRKDRRLCLRSAFALAALLGLGIPAPVQATDYTWSGGAAGTNTSWSGNAWNANVAYVNAAGNNMIINTRNGAGTIVSPMSVSGNITVGQITFDNVNSRLPATLFVDTAGSGTTPRTLTVHTGITLANTNTTVEIRGSGGSSGSPGAPLSYVLGADNAFSVSTGGTLIMNSTVPISGAFNITKSGAGTLTLNAPSTFGGAGKSATLSAGTLNINNATALGNASNTFIVNGGTIDNTSAAAITTSNYAQTWGGDFTFTGTKDLNLGTGAVSLGANAGATRTITTTAGTLTIGGVISEGTTTKALTKAGGGTLTLSGASSYTGATKVSAGTLALGASGDVASSSKIAVASGATLNLTAKTGGYSIATGKTLEGNGTVSVLAGQSLTIGGSGTTIAPGTVDSSSTTTATLTVTGGGLTFGGGGKYEFTLDSAGGATPGTNWDKLAITQALTITATSGSKFTIDVTGAATGFSGTSNYSWQLATMASTTGFDVNAFAVTQALSGATGTFSLASTGTALSLVYTAPALTSYTWTGGGGDALWSTGANWGGTAPTAGGVPIIFAGTTNISTNNDLTANTSFNGITFDATAGSFTLAGNAVDLAGDVVNNSTNSQTISLSMRLTGTTRTLNAASGALAVSAIDLNGQNLVFNGANAISAGGIISGSGNVSQSGAGTTTLGAANTFTGTTTVSNGTLLYGVNNALGNGAVQVTGGVLDLATFSDTVGSFSITSGSLNGSGTLTAATYSLGGGTINGNLGAGTATAASGTTALNGTLAADLTISGGTVNLGASDRLGNTAAVSVTSGTLGMGAFNDTVGSFAITGGTLGGTGTLTAATYSLGGGTVTANLGAGAATAASGTTTLNGTLAADLTVSGGTVNLGAAERLGSTSAVSITSGTLGMSTFDNTVGSFAISGGTLGGSGTLTAATYALQGGTINAKLGTGAVTVSTGTTTLGSTGRLHSASTLTVNSGQLTIAPGGAESVAAVTHAGGTISGGTLTSATDYDLQAGTAATVLAGPVGVNKTTGGVYTMSSANTYTGTTAVKDGSLQLIGGDNRIATTGAVVIGGIGTTGKLILGNSTAVSNQTLTALTSSGGGGSVVGGNASPSTLTTNIASGTNTFNGTIGGAGLNEDNVALSKTGAGTLELGSTNTFTGGTTISAGTVRLAASGAAGAGGVTMSAGSLLSASGTSHANSIVIGTPAGLGPASLLAGWDFQTTATGGTAASAAPGSPLSYTANFGSGTISLNGANTSSTWTSGASNPQVTSFGGTIVNAGPGFSTTTSGTSALALANSSSNGFKVVVAFDMTGKSNLTLSYATQGTATGFSSQLWEYSSDLTNWTTLQNVNSIPGSYATQTLPTITALNGLSTAYLRMTVSGATNTSGNNRFDNIQLNASSPSAASGTGTLGIDTAGTTTFSGAVTVHNTATFTAAAGGTAVFTGAVGGLGTVTKTGDGTVTANPAADNSFAPAGIEVDAGTLLLGGSNKIGNSTSLTLAGGTFALNGNSEGAAGTTGLGALILASGSTIDFGSGDNFNLVQFAGVGAQSGILSILNWDGGDEHLLFAGDASAFTSLYDQNEVIFNGEAGYGALQFSGYYEIVAIPEPATIFGGLGLIGLVGLRERRRLQGLWKKQTAA